MRISLSYNDIYKQWKISINDNEHEIFLNNRQFDGNTDEMMNAWDIAKEFVKENKQ